MPKSLASYAPHAPAPAERPLIETIKAINLEDLTPSQALETLHRWRAELF